MGRNWSRNLPLKVGAVVAAIAGTFGFYGLIQAHPLSHPTTSSAAAAPAIAGSNDQGVPAAVNGNDQSQPVEQAPQQTIPRQRVSRGS